MPREENKEVEEERRAKSAYDLIRIRLRRLEKNIDKPAPVPARREPPKPKPPMEFVRNVVGSSAAAGSAEFHIFRNNRRKETERLEYLEREGIRQELDAEFEQKKQARREAEEKRTEKKRLKRLRRKEKLKNKRAKKKKTDGDESTSESDSDKSDESEDEAEQTQQASKFDVQNEEKDGATLNEEKSPNVDSQKDVTSSG